MRDYSAGIPAGQADDSYRQWLSRNPSWVVVNRATNRRGLQTLHRANCDTLSYPLASRGDKQRSGKWCFESLAELEDWLKSQGKMLGDLNRCPRCME